MFDYLDSLNDNQFQAVTTDKKKVFVQDDIIETMFLSMLYEGQFYTFSPVTHLEDTNLTEFLELNNWNHAHSYRASRIFMLDKQNTYKSLKYYIDIRAAESML